MKHLPNNARNYSPANKARIRRLRSEMSISEQTLWAFIRKKKLGFLFRRQHPIGSYSLDFYCPEAKLCVEVDGEQHEHSRDRDALRDAKLAELGVITIRVPSLDLFEPTSVRFSYWIRQIVEACEERRAESSGQTG